MSESERDPLPWYAVRVKANRERVVSDLLEAKGFEQFVPGYPVKRQWSDRTREIFLPLFPGYVFCRFEARQPLAILTTPGVVNFVGFGRGPEPIAPDCIRAVRQMVDSKLSVSPWPFLNVGDTVRITHGPLEGVEGILTEFKGSHRLIVSIPILQRSVACELDGSWVRALPRFRAPRAS